MYSTFVWIVTCSITVVKNVSYNRFKKNVYCDFLIKIHGSRFIGFYIQFVQ